MDDLVAFLRARYDEEAQAASAASDGPWTAWRESRLHGLGDLQHVVLLPGQKPGARASIATASWVDAEHIAKYDPGRVLREIEAKRKLVEDLLAEKHDVVDDCWYTCAAATEDRDGGETCDDSRQGGPCDCGRDARVARRLGFLALPYAEHPDYREEWRP